MKFDPLTDHDVRTACSAAGISGMRTITKIEIGFSNYVYDIDGQYIVKASRTSDDDEIDLRKEIYLCNYIKDVVPAPTILYSDESRTAINRVFIVYRKIQGQNLYQRWHTYTESERRELIKTICNYVRAIASLPYAEFVSKFNLTVPIDWEVFIASRIDELIEQVKAEGSLPQELEQGIREFVTKNRGFLKVAKLALLYVDPHFDNFLVEGSRITGMLDFESMNVRSIDWVLHLVQRMQQEPKKYASESFEDSINPADYTHLMKWYREFYPELFEFKNIDVRLKLYAIKHNLSDLVGWPHVESLRGNLRKIVSM